jgi:hypothetical protein
MALSRSTVGAARNGLLAGGLAVLCWVLVSAQYWLLQVTWDGNRLAGQGDIIQQQYDQTFNGLSDDMPLPAYESDLPIGILLGLGIYVVIALACSIFTIACIGFAVASGSDDLDAGSRIASFVRKVRGRFTSSAPQSEETVHEEV